MARGGAAKLPASVARESPAVSKRGRVTPVVATPVCDFLPIEPAAGRFIALHSGREWMLRRPGASVLLAAPRAERSLVPMQQLHLEAADSTKRNRVPDSMR